MSVQHHQMIMTIRKASQQDAAALVRLYHLLTGDARVDVRAERIAALQYRDDHALWVVELEGGVVGTALVMLCMDVMYGNQPFAVVENIIIDPAYQRQGLGRVLLQHIEAQCLAADCSKIMLQSSVARVEAHRLFRTLGYSSERKLGFVKYRSQMGGKDESDRLARVSQSFKPSPAPSHHP